MHEQDEDYQSEDETRILDNKCFEKGLISTDRNPLRKLLISNEQDVSSVLSTEKPKQKPYTVSKKSYFTNQYRTFIHNLYTLESFNKELKLLISRA